MTKKEQMNVRKAEKWISGGPRSNYVQQGLHFSFFMWKERKGWRATNTEIERNIS